MPGFSTLGARDDRAAGFTEILADRRAGRESRFRVGL